MRASYVRLFWGIFSDYQLCADLKDAIYAPKPLTVLPVPITQGYSNNTI